MPIVPGIGYAGLGQQTQANQLVFRQGMGGRSNGTPRRRRSKKKAARRVAKRARRASGSRKMRKFVKGSAAAKRHMAKLRRMRKRK